MSSDASFTQGPTNRSMPESTVIPVLHYPDVRQAAEWLCRAFGFSERLRIGTHRIQLSVGTGAVVAAESQDPNVIFGGPGHSVMIRVANVDQHYARAKSAGARLFGEPTSYPFGERQYSAADPGGHVWTFSQSEANVDPGSWGGELVSS
jgi:uncharacterized glyoxalase superfamily protein PhnB